jgi:ElaB/YqjD/DUF883 family membrane-anchored ribosome-binding protein
MSNEQKFPNLDSQNNPALRTDLFPKVKEEYDAVLKEKYGDNFILECLKKFDDKCPLKTIPLKKKNFDEKFWELHQQYMEDIVNIANNTLSIEDKWRNAKGKLFELYEDNSEYYAKRFCDGKEIVMDELSGKWKLAKDYVNEELPEVVAGTGAVVGLVAETIGESGKIIVDNTKEMKKSAEEMVSSLYDTAQKKLEKYQKKDEQALERINDSGVLKEVLISLEGEYETKEQRIAKVDSWLEQSKNSISAFANCSYDKNNEKEVTFSKAALNQLRAEKCYSVYREELASCTLSDDLCLLKNHQLVDQCHKFALQATKIFKN